MGKIKITQFNGKVIKSAIEANKQLDFGESIRTLTISDLHNYTTKKELRDRLAVTIGMQKPDIIFIAGDLFNGGTSWEGGKELEALQEFLTEISKFCPVVLSWGNHDLRGMTEENKDIRLANFLKLKELGDIHPLFNDKVIINGMEIIGYVPRFELMEGKGLQKQLHGLAHKGFIEDYMKEGVQPSDEPGLLRVYIGHDPHLIAANEHGVGLEGLSKCDFFITGHLHDGYKPVLSFFDNLKRKITGYGIRGLEQDNGYTEQPTGVVDKDGKKIRSLPKIWGKTNLCRGIVYINDDAQQRILQLPDGRYYVNMVSDPNVQDWKPCSAADANMLIDQENLHYMLISEGINPGFYPNEKMATINVVDIHGKAR